MVMVMGVDHQWQQQSLCSEWQKEMMIQLIIWKDYWAQARGASLLIIMLLYTDSLSTKYLKWVQHCCHCCDCCCCCLSPVTMYFLWCWPSSNSHRKQLVSGFNTDGTADVTEQKIRAYRKRNVQPSNDKKEIWIMRYMLSNLISSFLKRNNIVWRFSHSCCFIKVVDNCYWQI